MLTAASPMDTAVTPEARNALLELRGEPGFATRNRLAMRDVREGARLLPLAWTLGWLDIRLRYRGSMLGPLWLTLSTGIMVGALGYLYAGIFHTDIQSYLPFLALSLVLWGFLNSSVAESCTAFTESEGIVRAVRMPFFLFAARVLIRNVLVLAHNILVIAVVYVVFQVWPGWHATLAIPGLLLWGIDCLALVLLLGTFCARFRDILPIVASVMQIAFFITPIIWKPEQLGRGQALLPFNPFFDLLEIARAPLLGMSPGTDIWLGAGLYSLVLWGLAWSLFTRARGRIAFWI
jgi:lipopolysaccharide transport system permease protein